MGCVKNVGYDKFPKQGGWLGAEVEVCFNYRTDQLIRGVVVRDDMESPNGNNENSPGLTVIRLEDGRHVLATECQFSIVSKGGEPSRTVPKVRCLWYPSEEYPSGCEAEVDLPDLVDKFKRLGMPDVIEVRDQSDYKNVFDDEVVQKYIESGWDRACKRVLEVISGNRRGWTNCPLMNRIESDIAALHAQSCGHRKVSM